MELTLTWTLGGTGATVGGGDDDDDEGGGGVDDDDAGGTTTTGGVDDDDGVVCVEDGGVDEFVCVDELVPVSSDELDVGGTMRLEDPIEIVPDVCVCSVVDGPVALTLALDEPWTASKPPAANTPANSAPPSTNAR